MMNCLVVLSFILIHLSLSLPAKSTNLPFEESIRGSDNRAKKEYLREGRERAGELNIPAEVSTQPAPKVLAVDDSKPQLKIVEMCLIKIGCEVEISSNGQEAVEKIKTAFYDLLITDGNMPIMDGIALIGYVRENKIVSSTGKALPIILCSSEEKYQNSSSELRYSFLLKPLMPEKLKTTVSELLRDRKLHG